MNWVDVSVQLVKALAKPAATLLALYWFRASIKGVFDAVAYVIREGRIKTSFPGGSLETDSTAREALQNEQREIEATPSPAVNVSSVPDLIEARRFILRDENGRARAEIATQAASGRTASTIRLFDSSGQTKVFMVCREDGLAGVSVSGQEEAAISLIGAEEGDPYLSIRGANGGLVATLDQKHLALAESRVILGETEGQSPFILLKDKGGNIVFSEPS